VSPASSSCCRRRDARRRRLQAKVATLPSVHLNRLLLTRLAELEREGRRKAKEDVIAGFTAAEGERGPRVILAGKSGRAFLRMNSNSYLGLSMHEDVIAAADDATRRFGTGPGAVRFISGTYVHHVELERRLADFHGREAGMLFNSAYAAIVGTLVPLITAETAVVSDELNHNSIVNALRLARPNSKAIYRHLDLEDLETKLASALGQSRRAIVVTDGVFSMRGDHAPLREINAVAERYRERFPEGVLVVVDDSHGVGAVGDTGRGTEEHAQAPPADVIVATLGKALGVNGGYVVSEATMIEYLRETAPLYVYSNPISVGEAAAATAALEILDGSWGRKLLAHLRTMTDRFRSGLVELGFETIPGQHPVVPLVVRDTARTAELVRHLYDNDILATGLTYPVVPLGEEEIRFQISAAHTAADIDYTLAVLADFPQPLAGADE
jgi:glycine C-acetyltransferase